MHARIMTLNGLNITDLVEIRHKLHQYPEGGFKEVETQKLIRDTLLSYGVDESAIKTCAKTGLIVDLKGTAEE
jgi:metal-dependent amidase/aminoacylase/carboxypeptidase family protein